MFAQAAHSEKNRDTCPKRQFQFYHHNYGVGQRGRHKTEQRAADFISHPLPHLCTYSASVLPLHIWCVSEHAACKNDTCFCQEHLLVYLIQWIFDVISEQFCNGKVCFEVRSVRLAVCSSDCLKILLERHKYKINCKKLEQAAPIGLDYSSDMFKNIL